MRGKMVWSELRYSKTGARGKERKYTHTHIRVYICISRFTVDSYYILI